MFAVFRACIFSRNPVYYSQNHWRGKRLGVTIFAGHYGSGKTTVAVNYVLELRKQAPGLRKQAPGLLALCDMDIVNPYFRTADHAKLLAENGVELISSAYANSGVEAVWYPTQAARVFDDPGLDSVVDLGGDDCGALALGRYAARIEGRKDIRLLMVVNPCRPLTRDVGGLLQIKREIENVAGIPFAGMVNNTNLGGDTTAALITGCFGLVREMSRALGLPFARTAIPAEIPLEVPADLGKRLDITRYPNRFGFN